MQLTPAQSGKLEPEMDAFRILLDARLGIPGLQPDLDDPVSMLLDLKHRICRFKEFEAAQRALIELEQLMIQTRAAREKLLICSILTSLNKCE